MAARLEVSDDNWIARSVVIEGDQVAKVDFNEASKSTEVTMKSGASYVAVAFCNYETDEPNVIPVQGTVAEVKQKLGLN